MKTAFTLFLGRITVCGDLSSVLRQKVWKIMSHFIHTASERRPSLPLTSGGGRVCMSCRGVRACCAYARLTGRTDGLCDICCENLNLDPSQTRGLSVCQAGITCARAPTPHAVVLCIQADIPLVLASQSNQGQFLHKINIQKQEKFRPFVRSERHNAQLNESRCRRGGSGPNCCLLSQ